MGNSNDKINSIKTSNGIMIINILQNWSHMYSSHHRIIKCVDFKLIYCAINLDVALSFKVISKFNSLFLSDVSID